MKEREKTQMVDEILRKKDEFNELNEVQKEVYRKGIFEDKNFMIVTPTGSGKTFCAEMRMYNDLRKGKKCLYLSPLHALKDQILDELDYFEDHTVNTPKDKGSWDEADVMVTTFERAYGIALRHPGKLGMFDTVIVDEFHLLYDSMRGFTLEKLLTFLRQFDFNIMIMSATFEPKKDFSSWFDAELIHVPNRKRMHDVEVLETNKDHIMEDIVTEKSKYPILYFTMTVKSTISNAGKIADGKSKKYEKEDIKKDLTERIDRLELTDKEKKLVEFLARGVAFHNSRITAEAKKYIVDRFKEGKIDVLVATTTLAYGFDASTKTVIIQPTNRWNPQMGSSKPIPVYEFMQMKGRAGRKEKGYCYFTDSCPSTQYKEGHIEEAKSYLFDDSYLQKLFLELLWAGKAPEEIIEYFENTYFMHESNSNPLSPDYNFDMKEYLISHIKKLNLAGYIQNVPGGFKLTKFGENVVDFCVNNTNRYPLGSFNDLRSRLESKESISFDMWLLMDIVSVFNAKIFKDGKSDEVAKIFNKVNHKTATVVSIYKGWMQGLPVSEIADKFKVYASHMSYAINRIFLPLYDFYIKESRRQGKEVDRGKEKEFRTRLKYGLSKKQTNLLARHVGRETIIKIKRYVEKRQIENDDTDRKWVQFLGEIPNGRQKEILMNVDGVGDKRADNIIDKLRNEVS